MRYFVIGDERTVLGFSLAGIEGAVAVSEESAQRSFEFAISDPDAGILMITERIAELIRPLVDELLFSDRFPLVLEIPDAEGRLEGKPGLREMVNHAIGITV